MPSDPYTSNRRYDGTTPPKNQIPVQPYSPEPPRYTPSTLQNYTSNANVNIPNKAAFRPHLINNDNPIAIMDNHNAAPYF